MKTMSIPRLFRGLAVAALLIGVARPCFAEPGGDGDFATLQADAQKTFRDNVSPFINTYCIDCHGNKKRKGNFNIQPVFKKPGGAESNRLWKQALANVKSHDMPPDDAPKQPTDAERALFVDWIPKAKFLSPKDPGPFVIRRLTRSSTATRSMISTESIRRSPVSCRMK